MRLSVYRFPLLNLAALCNVMKSIENMVLIVDTARVHFWTFIHNSFTATVAPNNQLKVWQQSRCCMEIPKLNPYWNQCHRNSVMVTTVWGLWKSGAAHRQTLMNTLDRTGSVFSKCLKFHECDLIMIQMMRVYSLVDPCPPQVKMNNLIYSHISHKLRGCSTHLHTG